MPKQNDGHYRVVSPYYVALLIIEGGKVRQAAPILKWARGKPAGTVFAHFDRRGFEYKRLSEGG